MWERFEIKRTTAGVTEMDGLAATWGSLTYDFLLPVNQRLRFKKGDYVAATLIGDDAAAMPDSTLVRLVVTDNAGKVKHVLFNGLYARMQDFRDVEARCYLQIDREIYVEAGEHVVMLVNGLDAAATGDVDASAGTIKISCDRWHNY